MSNPDTSFPLEDPASQGLGGSESPWYKTWFDSPWYAMLYRYRDDEEARSFIGRLIAELAPAPDSLMLDLACGEGRHARHLASLGFDVTGLDLSTRNIELAKTWEHEKLHFYQHDMRKPFRINYFDYIFNFFTSFGYFDDSSDNLQALKAIALGLKPGATLVLDYLNVPFAVGQLVEHEQRQVEGVLFDIHRHFDGSFFHKSIQVQTAEQRLNFSERVQAISLDQFHEWFSLCGMSIQGIFGSYSLELYRENLSPRLILMAQKMATQQHRIPSRW